MTTPQHVASRPDLDRDVALSVRGVHHRYGTASVLNGIDLDVARGEFVTLLGPSGCGKTTLLRIIGGFLSQTDGEVRIDDRDVTRLPPHKRPVNTVFQRVTMFPHLDVFDNVAFGLRLDNLPAKEVDTRVREALDLVRMGDFRKRRSHELSGGQMQRVSLARALAKRPKVLLLDEPLSALDLQIRLGMEEELRRVHRETGATFVYVTHDQREALALSDRVAVFNRGSIEQIGTAEEVYSRPASAFVGSFVGDANILRAEVEASASGPELVLAGARASCPRSPVESGPVEVVIRQEAFRVVPTGQGTLTGVVEDASFRGASVSYKVRTRDGDRVVKVESPLGPNSHPHAPGDEVGLTWDPDAMWILDARPPV